jgi:transcriptional regulator with GAF, ATPase, and Fis domain
MITVDCLPPEIAAGQRVTNDWAAPQNEQTIVGDRPTMDELQRRYLQLILDENQGKKRRAARVLGLDRRTVQRLVSRYMLRAAADAELEEDVDPEISPGAEEENL